MLRLPAGTSALLYDATAASVVFASDENAPYVPASITKLLTLCLIEERLNELGVPHWQEIEVTGTAAGVDSRWGFVAGEKIQIGLLMQAAAIVSSNEAANALAEWHSGSNEAFTWQLNQRAADLGMSSTLLSSPSGLGQHQKSNASDLLVLALYVLSHHSAVAALCAKPYFDWKGKRHASTNRLLHLPGTDGLKTGSLRAHGNHLVLSAIRGGRRWIAIVLGAPTKGERDDIVRALIETYAS